MTVKVRLQDQISWKLTVKVGRLTETEEASSGEVPSSALAVPARSAAVTAVATELSFIMI